MDEATFTTKLKRWIKHRFEETAAIEVKYTENGRIDFDAVEHHQNKCLFRTKHSSLPYKIADDSIARKPFDLFVLDHENAYVCLYFYSHGEKEFYLIDIDDWKTYKDRSEKKSINQEEAKNLALHVGQFP